MALRPKSAKSPISEKVGWLKVAGLVHHSPGAPEETPLAARGRRPANGRLRSTKKCATCEERGSVKFDGLPAVALEAEQRAAQGST